VGRHVPSVQRPSLTRGALAVGTGVLTLLAGFVLFTGRGVGASDRGGGAAAPAPPRQLSAIARYSEEVGIRESGGSATLSAEPPTSPARFRGPIRAYLRYAARQAAILQRDVRGLAAAADAGNRVAARAAWRSAFARYLRLGAVYGAFGDLDSAIDGRASGLSRGARDRRFTGLHRIEHGLWGAARVRAIEPSVARLALDVRRLRRAIPRAHVTPLDYATRAHEILEGAQRDFLTGVDVPWSHEGVLATSASLEATRVVIRTLRPLLAGGQALNPVLLELSHLGTTLASIRHAHDGRLPALGGLRVRERERLDASLSSALERLQRIPPSLETTDPVPIPRLEVPWTGSLLALGAGGTYAATAARATESPGAIAATGGLLDRVAFDGPHQAGVLTPPQAHATFVALDAVADTRADLRAALQALSYKARALAAGGRTIAGVRDEPPADSGTLGAAIAPDSLTVTVAFGASMFDERYGLAQQRPAALTRMPVFATDRLIAAQTHGDLLLQICAGQRDTVVHALRELMRALHGSFELRWAIDGFQSAARGPTRRSSSRNLFAFRDGTSNPDVGDAALMRRLVWTADGPGTPAWAAGGTVQVVRIIRMHVEFWDRVGLREQENMIGRARESGAPLGGSDEFQDPRFDLDPKGARIPLDAHIRLANPRTPATDGERILRRGYNYHRGFDAAGSLDQGLVFVAFNRDPARQFAVIQKRLTEEPMVDYISAVGGGYFFVAPGTGGIEGYAGERMFA
jgi:deferrochelatase/peroxidase EfeB